MKSLHFVIAIVYAVHLLALDVNVRGEDANVNSEGENKIEELDVTQSYCFQFSWMGPDYDNTTKFNKTCGELLEEGRDKHIPCRQPLVISYDSSKPDLDHMWDNYKMRVACKMSKGDVCARYSYSFNDEIVNATYMCTKVFAVNEGAVTSGCYKQKVGSYENEMCVCKSSPGDYLPCNAFRE